MKSDEPASTITTASGHIGSNNTIHPFENRVLSTLECALLQTFPLSFKWGDSLERSGHTNVRAMIGEAVPPLFTRLHGKVLLAILDHGRTTRLLPATDSRCTKAMKPLRLTPPVAASQ
jgi:DNA (cytosine-5)-methyltransferase 1